MTNFKNAKIATLLGFLFLGTLTLGTLFPLALSFSPALLGLVGTTLFYISEKRIPKIDHNILLCILILSGILIASSFWSVSPSISLSRGLKVSALFLLSCPLLFLCHELPDKSLHILKKWCAIPLLVSAVIIYIELRFSYPIYRFLAQIPDDTLISPAELNKHVSVLTLLAPFGIIFSIRARFITFPLLLAVLTGLVLSATEDNAAQLSMIIMILSVPCLMIMPKAAPRIAFGSIAFILLFMPWISPVAFDAFAEPLAHKNTFAQQANMSMRLENWDFLSRRIAENPWTGFGVDTTRTMTFDTDQKYFRGNTILHPHNVVLQLWIECGLIGVMYALGVLAFLYHRLTSLSLPTRIMPFAILGGLMVFLLVSWSCWASWLDGFIVLVAGLLILAIRPKAVQLTS